MSRPVKPSLPTRRREDDTESLTSVPSLTGTATTADSVSSLNPITPTCFDNYRPRRLNRRPSWQTFDVDLRPFRPRREPLVTSTAKDRIRYRQSRLYEHIPLFESDRDQQLDTEIIATRSLQSVTGEVVHFAPTSAHANDKFAIETQSPFLANILLPDQDGVQLVDAAECEGDQCYVSQELIDKHGIIPEDGHVRIAWRKLDDNTFIHSQCKLLERIQIKGDAYLILGRGRKRQQWNDCETVEEVIALTGTRLSQTSLNHFDLHQKALLSRPNPENASSGPGPEDGVLEMGSKSTGRLLLSLEARQKIEDSPDSGTESCSSVSSSDESSATTKDSVETRREQIIERVIAAITEWLRLRFLQAHAKAAQATSNPAVVASGPSGISSQSSQSQSQPDHKRKRSEDESENSDSDRTKRPNPKVGNNKGKEKEGLRYACPYFKHNPVKYQQWGTCLGPGWEEVRRVK